jgi:selenophosphate synthetase-related protein
MEMLLKMTSIPAEGANVIVDFGDDCCAVQHDNGNVGIYVKDGNELLRISDRLIRNPNKSGVQIAKEMWGA